jgi:NADPH:quinone reductase
MKTMRALCFDKYGPPSVLQLKDLSVPELAPGQVLIKVEASVINPSDVKDVAGAFHAALPRVPGRDYAGTVVAGDDRWAGTQVWGSGSGFGVVHDGAHAQFVVAPIEGLSAKPSSLSMQEAATVGVSCLAAWSALVDAADIQSGETVLVTGVGGAVGHAATQIAQWRGARVIGADINDRPSGADLFINTTGKDLATEVKSLTKGVGVDMVLDCVGGPMFEPSLNSLRLGGRQVAIASAGNRRVEFDLIDTMARSA